MINQIFNWIVENKEWFFSGIGVTIVLGIGGLIRKWFVKNRDREETIKFCGSFHDRERSETF